MTPGAKVAAVSINKSGIFTFEAGRVGKDTTLSQMIRLVEDTTLSQMIRLVEDTTLS